MSIEDLDGFALQEALTLIQIILKTDPGVYDDLAAPVIELLQSRLRDVPEESA